MIKYWRIAFTRPKETRNRSTLQTQNVMQSTLNPPKKAPEISLEQVCLVVKPTSTFGDSGHGLPAWTDKNPSGQVQLPAV